MVAVKVFLAEMDELGDRLRGGFYTVGPEMYRGQDGHDHVKVPGNHLEVSACLGQVRDAWREANDQIPLETLDKAALEARLEALRESIVLPQR